MKPEQKLPTPKARELLAKLTALAERGVNGERDAAKRALARLKARYDFTKENKGGADIFDGVFIASTESQPVYPFQPQDWDIANAIKWAIESATGVPCLFHDGRLCARSDSGTAAKLHGIARTLLNNFAGLWRQYAATPGTNPADRGNFVLGLYEGMMGEERHGEALPRRATTEKPKRARKRDLAPAPGISVHPYTIAHGLGKQIRYCADFETVSGQLDWSIKGEIAA